MSHRSAPASAPTLTAAAVLVTALLVAGGLPSAAAADGSMAYTRPIDADCVTSPALASGAAGTLYPSSFFLTGGTTSTGSNYTKVRGLGAGVWGVWWGGQAGGWMFGGVEAVAWCHGAAGQCGVGCACQWAGGALSPRGPELRSSPATHHAGWTQLGLRSAGATYSYT